MYYAYNLVERDTDWLSYKHLRINTQTEENTTNQIGSMINVQLHVFHNRTLSVEWDIRFRQNDNVVMLTHWF